MLIGLYNGETRSSTLMLSRPIYDRWGIRVQKECVDHVVYSNPTGMSLNRGHYIKGSYPFRNTILLIM